MDEQPNLPDQPAGSSNTDSQPKRYQHQTATRIVPMQRDHLGRPFWESYLTPEGYQVRAEAQIPPHLPGVIIFVHGVNSEGEWYDAAEKAICEGLNERLNRNEVTRLKPNHYSALDQKGEPGTRHIVEIGHSPVIRFYWGYRARDREERKWRVALRNRRDFDFWAPQCTNERGPWYWGGGPFQNGTNNLQQLWSDQGFERKALGIFDLQQLNTETERQLHDAPPREYYAHASQRLAKLIDDIREHSPRDTVTVLSHSQGTMIAMAAAALCKTRAPDALFLMNSPFALKNKITDAVTCGRERPTEQARINTFRNIANRIKQDKRVHTEAQMQLLQVGATEDMNFWRPDLGLHYGLPERDNHGRLYVYFTPHDRVMGATPLQSIGWQGVDDKLLAELGDTVKQRMLARGMACGDAPGVRKFGSLEPIQRPVPGVDPREFWNGNRGALFNAIKLWAVPNADQTVTVNAEQVPNPLTADDMKDFEESRVDAPAWGQFDPDPANPNTGKHRDPTYRHMASIHQPEEFRTREDVYSNSGRKRSLETQEELQERINNYHPEPTNHSTLPSNQPFMRRVAAWDLPIGFCDAYEDREFWGKLIRKADWTRGYDPYFETGELDKVEKPSQIDWTTVAEEASRADAQRLKRGETK
jgi:pimeloyl-ACP methyl ester carboxylesterase